jgi:hypothetical protein
MVNPPLEPLEYTIGRAMGRGLLIIVGLYLLATALEGWSVGNAIYNAKTNPFAGMASAIAGREATEHFAISQMQVPPIVTVSPTFWLALRLTE